MPNPARYASTISPPASSPPSLSNESRLPADRSSGIAPGNHARTAQGADQRLRTSFWKEYLAKSFIFRITIAKSFVFRIGLG